MIPVSQADLFVSHAALADGLVSQRTPCATPPHASFAIARGIAAEALNGFDSCVR
jgi:hypothetical protein